MRLNAGSDYLRALRALRTNELMASSVVLTTHASRSSACSLLLTLMQTASLLSVHVCAYALFPALNYAHQQTASLLELVESGSPVMRLLARHPAIAQSRNRVGIVPEKHAKDMPTRRRPDRRLHYLTTTTETPA